MRGRLWPTHSVDVPGTVGKLNTRTGGWQAAEVAPMARKLSESMVNMLRNIAAGRSPRHGLVGNSEHAAAYNTDMALHRRGLVKDGALTDAGRAVLADLAPGEGPQP